MAVAALCLHGPHAFAQQEVAAASADSPDRQTKLESYTSDFFTQFQPQTALDMVDRIPGFTLRSGASERGFGDADTNFLINGRRPSTKSQSAQDILSRIPFDTVKRIEMLDGDALDIPGLSGQVVNIVARAVDLSGQWRYAARFEHGTEPQLLEGEVTLASTRGDVGFSLALESGQFLRTEDSEEQFFDGAGGVLEDRIEDIYIRNGGPSAAATLTWTPEDGWFAGHVANINLSGEIENDNSGVREIFVARGPGRISGDSFADNGSDEFEVEVGADYAFPLNVFGLDGQLKLIGLNRIEDENAETVFVNALSGQGAVRTAFAEDVKEGETIARTEYGFAVGQSHDVQLALEYAFNFLESDTRFENNFVAPLLDEVRVEEDRVNARITDSWQVGPDLSVQASVGAEYSSLQVVDPRSQARTFFRPKGLAAVSYKLSNRYAVRARAERSVGQLNFGTFVSDRSLADDVVTGGNAQIKPSQSWDLSVEFERTDDRLLSGRLRPYLELIEDPIDRVLLGTGVEGPGNLDSAKRYGIEANATLLFDTIGAPGLRFELSGGVGDSEIEDPLTGEVRQLNNNEEYSYNLFARYDRPGWDIALFGRVRNDESSPFFRLDEIRIIDVERPFLTLGLLHKDFFGMQLEVTGTNLLDSSVIRERQRFQTGDRRLGPLTFVERFDRQRGPRLSLVLTDTF